MASEEKSSKFSTIFLVVALVAVSFLAGSFYNRSREVTGGVEKVVPTGGAEVKGQAEPTNGLSDEQLAVLLDSPNVKGAEDAPVTIIEFSEYECPYCKRYVDETYSQIWDNYGDKIRYVFHDFPLSFHPHAQQNAEAARCAGEQGDYFGYHDLLFANREEWSTQADATSLLVGYAQELGLDTTQFSNCLTSGKYTQAVQDDFALGQSVGVKGTPAFFINGKFISGAQPYTVFKQAIEEALAAS